MLRPRVPTNPLPAPVVAPAPEAPVQRQTFTPPASVACQHSAEPAAPVRSGVQLSAGATVAAIGAGTVAVLVIGAVLVGMFLAVSITAGSLAIVALVARSLLNSAHNQR
ncbi:SpdD-like protein [Streptomyces sp. NPDC053048]|uniref:SpdD-like protein n=1 Tax=Streptomyces sp. NPDC053048 TaxID=3365694 RepID=UPI0037D6B752